MAEEVRHGDDLDRFDLPNRKQVVVTADEPMDSCRYRTGKKLRVVWVSQYRGRDGFTRTVSTKGRTSSSMRLRIPSPPFSGPLNGLADVRGFDPQVADFLSDGGKPTTMLCDCDRSEHHASLPQRHVKVVGVRYLFQNLLRQRHLVLRRLFG